MVGQRPRLDQETEAFQYYHATAVSFDNAAVRAWEFLRTNPLTWSRMTLIVRVWCRSPMFFYKRVTRDSVAPEAARLAA